MCLATSITVDQSHHLEPPLYGGKVGFPKGTWVGWYAPGVQSDLAL